MRTAVQNLLEHYQTERNNQGLANRIICLEDGHLGATGSIQRRQSLGGMQNCYYRDAPGSGRLKLVRAIQMGIQAPEVDSLMLLTTSRHENSNSANAVAASGDFTPAASNVRGNSAVNS